MSSVDLPDESVRSTSSVLLRFLEHIAEQHLCSTADNLAATDLTLSQLRMLLVLHHGDEPMSVNALAEAVGLSLAAAGRGADRLVGLELVDRREDPADRRVKRLSLTDQGQALLDDQFALKADDLTSCVASLPETSRTRLRDTLTDTLTHLSPEKVTP
ncbi:MarR family winged helix-turn-helix transcriptional regulator [Gordonia zhaorongruii]|uniref:MarR family winged helix-turn-helix transcriptional regulator n=1 Tax=Gordonia zhaorongruii TaxID=2597659 RepID=UPI001051F47E|nr:MarR family transcriptional regulator [Gordonia zhaorongruii]